jgi:plastocyanin
MRLAIGMTLVLASLVASGCASDTTNPDGGGGLAANQVAVRDNVYVPASLTVSEGTTVTWLWQGVNLHTVTFDAQNLPSTQPQSSGSLKVTFNEPGVFTYYCAIHGRAVMSGEIVVERAGGPTN